MDPAETFLGFVAVLSFTAIAGWGLVAFIEWLEGYFD